MPGPRQRPRRWRDFGLSNIAVGAERRRGAREPPGGEFKLPELDLSSREGILPPREGFWEEFLPSLPESFLPSQNPSFLARILPSFPESFLPTLGARQACGGGGGEHRGSSLTDRNHASEAGGAVAMYIGICSLYGIELRFYIRMRRGGPWRSGPPTLSSKGTREKAPNSQITRDLPKNLRRKPSNTILRR